MSVLNGHWKVPIIVCFSNYRKGASFIRRDRDMFGVLSPFVSYTSNLRLCFLSYMIKRSMNSGL